MSTEVTAHRLKMLMRERNWGVKAFANRIPADKNSVKTWLAGQYYPRYDSLVKVCELLDVSADYVVGQCTRQPIDARIVLRYRCTTRANPSKSCVVQRMRLGEPRFRGPANNRRAQPADKPFLSPENASGSPHIEGSHLLV